MLQEFSFDIYEDNCILPKYLLGDQFYSYFTVKKKKENSNHVIYYIRCSIERNYYLNNYMFYLKHNKEKDYYILNDSNGNTVDNVYDNESDYSIIEAPIINNMLINICGHIPKLYFGDILNKTYSKINKYINNNLRKITLQFRHEINYLENYLNKIVTLYDIEKYNNDLFKRIQYKFINLFIKLDNKEFIVQNVSYKIESLKFNNVLLKSSYINYSFKIEKKNLKINEVKYLY
jgi:hypothetical protein